MTEGNGVAPVAGEPGAPRATRDDLLGLQPLRVEHEMVVGEPGQERAVTVVFEPAPPAVYDELLLRHQPTAEQRELSPTLIWNPATFPPALIAASLVEPELSAADVEDLWRSRRLDVVEADSLFGAALRVNNGRRARREQVGKGSASTPASGLGPSGP